MTFKHDCNLATKGIIEARLAVSKVGKAFSSFDNAPLTSDNNSGLRRRRSSPDSVPESSIILLGLDCARCDFALIDSPFVCVTSLPSDEDRMSVPAGKKEEKV